MFRYVVPLSHKTEEIEPGPLGMLKTLPARRLEFRIGKLALPDFFDINAIGSDSHLQFLNWTVVNNGAWDYAADTRGYTWGAYAEYHDVNWSLRFVEALMPKIANGIDLEWNLRRARGQNLELELRPHLLSGRNTTIRLLAYRNVADMGNYREAIRNFLSHQTATPDIVASRQPGRTKNGVGLNVEQELTSLLRAFLRVGWNDGHNESFAYTEVDQTVLVGGDFRGTPWRRKDDKIGVAFVSNGLSTDQRNYLALGGLGFLLGDGALIYGRENIVESYYTAHVWRGVFAALDLQHINNPGYDRARGPVWVPGLRLHLDF
jgi:carbohydrate-selective porin OprB